MRQNLTLKSAICILAPAMNSLGLVLPQLVDFVLSTCTKTAVNNPPVTVQDKGEVWVEQNPQRLFKVSNTCKIHILYKQHLSLLPGGSDLGHAVFMQNIAAFTEGTRVAFLNNTYKHRINAKTRNRPTTFGEKYLNFLDRTFKLYNLTMRRNYQSFYTRRYIKREIVNRSSLWCRRK